MNGMTAVIPAHNEEASIGGTIQSIRANGVSRIIAVLDNCTDDTRRVALSEGAECFETVGNADKKAGALNQALTVLLDAVPDDHLVLVADADTEIAPEFVAVALHALEEGADAVGGVFRGSAPRNLIEACQANEYARYAREIDRTRRVMVLSGTASLIPVGVLRAVREERNPIMGKLSPDKTVARFWRKVDKNGPTMRPGLSPCWIFTGRTQADGYGEFDVPYKPYRNRSVLAHRYSYALGRELQDGAYVLHTCDNPPCVNPDHLYAGDQSDNMRDCVERGRKHDCRGEGNGNASLTWGDVRAIRSAVTGAYGEKAALARKYGVSKSHIGAILSGKVWRDGDEAVTSGVYDPNAVTED